MTQVDRLSLHSNAWFMPEVYPKTVTREFAVSRFAGCYAMLPSLRQEYIFTNTRKIPIKLFIIAAVSTGITPYFIFNFYLLVYVFYELYFPSFRFYSKDKEIALVAFLFGAFYILPSLTAKIRSKVLKANLVTIILTFIIIILIGSTNLGTFLSRPLVISDELSDADVIIVPDTYFLDLRFRYGAQLYKHGYADKMVVFAPREYILSLSEENGVPIEKIFCVPGISTYTHAVNAKALFVEKKWQNGILVTMPYHMLRASKAFAKQGVKILHAPIPDSLWYGHPSRFIDDRDFFQKELNDYSFKEQFRIRHTWFRQIMHEYTGLIYYYLKGYI